LVIERWGRLSNELRCSIEIIIHANYVKVNNEEQAHIQITKEKVNLIFFIYIIYYIKLSFGNLINFLKRKNYLKIYGKIILCDHYQLEILFFQAFVHNYMGKINEQNIFYSIIKIHYFSY
jgi:hypothetical protein